MPLRSPASCIAQRLQRHVHTSAVRRADSTHYETLQVPVDAPPTDIKKSFYALSKRHHPDRNPNDPHASTRFVKISEAYAVLGSPDKRHHYDRDVLRRHHTSPHHATPRGSFHSSGPAGGRPASGLSRRKTHFQGPPPSFFRNGGWGSQSARRQAAADESAANAQAAGQQPYHGSQEGGMGPGQAPFGKTNDVPHFDREAHLRTHTAQERRRRQRMSGADMPTEPDRGTLVNFIFVGSIISLGVFIPSYILEKVTKTRMAER
ncbi:MAG: hypothetical protein M1818_008352 [Claussenomyces sp. TS43310]|nr:MAG: hypothetical protein M1818_008352 [Claussenomyces sp. TS43310]